MSLLAELLEITRGDTLTLKYKLTEDGAAKDITGMVFKLGVKKSLSDADPLFTVTGTITGAANGEFEFTLTTTETDQAAFAGLYEIAMYDASSNKTTLTVPGGAAFRIVGEIL